MKGGQVSTNVTVVLKPMVLITLLKFKVSDSPFWRFASLGRREDMWVYARREEAVEGARRQVEALHEDKEPCADILACLLEAVHRRAGADQRVGRLVLLHTGVGELALAAGEPAGCKGRVREEPEADDGHGGSDSTLNDEEPRRPMSARISPPTAFLVIAVPTKRREGSFLPTPPCKTAGTVHAGEDAGSNEPREPSGQDLGAVQHGDASSHLCSGSACTLDYSW